MAQGKTDKVGRSTTDDAEKDFKGSKVEGKKDKKNQDAPVTCETVIENLRKKKYPI